MRLIRNGGWKWFLLLSTPIILLAFGLFWVLDKFYLNDIEELEKRKE